MAKNKSIEISISVVDGKYHYTFSGDDINTTSGDVDYSSVSDEVNIKFKIKTSGYTFAAGTSTAPPLKIDGNYANTENGEFSNYGSEKEGNKTNLKIKDLNGDGLSHTYNVELAKDGESWWMNDPAIQNRGISK